MRAVAALVAALASAAPFTALPVEAPKKAEIYVDEADRAKPWHAGWSDATVSGDWVYLSGVIASLGEGELKAPTPAQIEAAFDRAFARIGLTLQKSGIAWDDVVDITAYMTDVDTQLSALDRVRLKHMRPPYAASTVVQVARLIPKRGIAELRLVARKPGAARPSMAGDTGKATKWINGKWFDGAAFVETTFHSVGGNLTQTEIPGAAVVDLGGKYVVPAFGDAHHHGIDREEGLEAKIDAFLRDGVFYVKNPNVIPGYLTPSMRAKLNRPGSLDVVFSNGGLTGSNAHPGPLHDRLAARGVFPGMTSAEMEGRAYFYLNTVEDVDRKWPRILDGKPDFIKTFLNGHEALAHPGHDHRSERGLSPDVLRAVVQRAHAAKLRVSSHVDTGEDAANAIRAGVDELNHMPIPDPLVSRDLRPYLIDPAVATQAARQGTFVVATASVGPRFRQSRWDAAMFADVVANQRANLETLMKAGVRIAIGSDGISGEVPFVTAKSEVDYLNKHKLADNLALLKMWSENTPATIFPGRKIGRLAAGYEANFLVLEGDPLKDFANVGRIWLRVKAGERLTFGPALRSMQ